MRDDNDIHDNTEEVPHAVPAMAESPQDDGARSQGRLT
jgi:hypothetical protein